MLNYTIKLIACYMFQKYFHDLTVKRTCKIAVSLARSFIFYFLTDVNVQFGLQPKKTTRNPYFPVRSRKEQFRCSSILWWPTTVTAKPKTSRQKQKHHGKTKNLTAKTKYLAAKPKTSRQKQNTSRQNQKPHFLKSKLLTKTSLIHVDVHCPQAEVRWHGIACLKDLSSQSNWFK